MVDLADRQTGILLVGHGSRDPAGHRPVRDLCRGLEQRLETAVVEPCYLELAEPTIEDGLAALARRGVREGIVVPLQLAAGRHVRCDIPSEVGRILVGIPQFYVSFTEHLGASGGLQEIAENRLREALSTHAASRGPTEFVLVARGSRDPSVRQEILQVADSRRMAAGDRTFSACFLAITQPSMEETLEICLRRNPSRIVIQPYLLYPGRLFRQIEKRIGQLRRRFPHIEWILAGPLGPDPSLVDCVAGLVRDAMADRRPGGGIGRGRQPQCRRAMREQTRADSG